MNVTTFSLQPRFAQKADALGLAGEGADPVAGLDVEVRQEPLANGCVVDALGNLDANEHPQVMTFL